MILVKLNLPFHAFYLFWLLWTVASRAKWIGRSERLYFYSLSLSFSFSFAWWWACFYSLEIKWAILSSTYCQFAFGYIKWLACFSRSLDTNLPYSVFYNCSFPFLFQKVSILFVYLNIFCHFLRKKSLNRQTCHFLAQDEVTGLTKNKFRIHLPQPTL